MTLQLGLVAHEDHHLVDDLVEVFVLRAGLVDAPPGVLEPTREGG